MSRVSKNTHPIDSLSETTRFANFNLLKITVFSEPWPPWEVFFSFCLTSRHQRRHQHIATTASGHQRRQRRGQCCRASGQTARRERAAEGATRAVGARRGSRRHCSRRVDNVTRASNEQRAAGGCNDDSGGDVAVQTAGVVDATRPDGYGGRCDNIRRRLRTSGDKDGIILSNYYYNLIPSSATCLHHGLVACRLCHHPLSSHCPQSPSDVVALSAVSDWSCRIVHRQPSARRHRRRHHQCNPLPPAAHRSLLSRCPPAADSVPVTPSLLQPLLLRLPPPALVAPSDR